MKGGNVSRYTISDCQFLPVSKYIVTDLSTAIIGTSGPPKAALQGCLRLDSYHSIISRREMDSASPAEPSRVGNIHGKCKCSNSRSSEYHTRCVGISLHIESEDERSSQVLTFDKSQSSAITIGRRSSHTRRSGSLRELDCALFRCPVVSRKHAKITFTKYGNVSIYPRIS